MYSGPYCGGSVMPASATLAPALCKSAIIVARLRCVSPTGRPRRPSLPPNSSTTICGCFAQNTRQALQPILGRVAADASFTTRSGSRPHPALLQIVRITLARSAPYPAVRLSPKQTITGRSSSAPAAAGSGAGFEAESGAEAGEVDAARAVVAAAWLRSGSRSRCNRRLSARPPAPLR